MQKKLFATTKQEQDQERYSELDRLLYGREALMDPLSGFLPFEYGYGRYVFVCPSNRGVVGEYVLLHNKLYSPYNTILPHLSNGWNLMFWQNEDSDYGGPRSYLGSISTFDLVNSITQTISEIPIEAPDDQAVSS